MTKRKEARVFAWIAAALFAVLLIYNISNTYENFLDNFSHAYWSGVLQTIARWLTSLGIVLTLAIAMKIPAAAAFGLRAIYCIWPLVNSVITYVEVLKDFDFPYDYVVVNAFLSLLANIIVVLLLVSNGSGGRKMARSLWFLPGVLVALERVYRYVRVILYTKEPKDMLLRFGTVMDILEIAAYLLVGLWIWQTNLAESEKRPAYQPGQVPLPQGWNPASVPAYAQNGTQTPAQGWTQAQAPYSSQGWTQASAQGSTQGWTQAQAPYSSQGWTQVPTQGPSQGWTQPQAPAPVQNWTQAQASAPAQNWTQAQAPAPSPAPSEDVTAAETLRVYKELMDAGVITPEDFEAKKKQVLGI